MKVKCHKSDLLRLQLIMNVCPPYTMTRRVLLPANVQVICLILPRYEILVYFHGSQGKIISVT